MMTANASSQHKVFLEKRGCEDVKVEVMVGITCSICGDSLPNARELGVHILAAHCDASQQPEETCDNLIIDGSPGLSMEVEVDPLEPTGRQEPTPTVKLEKKAAEPVVLNLPRAPTANELKQKFLAYKVTDTSFKYFCLVCDKMYTSRYNIRMHMNLHSGNNVHTCTFCGRKFAHKHVYESHVRTHTGERPFACERCDRRFGDRSNCSSHMKRCLGRISGSLDPQSPSSDKSSESISIAPNVSITPIKRVKRESDEEQDRLNELMETQSEDPLTLTFKPQIVAVQSMSFDNNNDEFENMGYAGEEDDAFEDSEEMMIEPDIRLHYDDAEDIAVSEQESEVQQSEVIYTCSFCSVKYNQQSLLLDHLNIHVDIPHNPTKYELDQGYMTLYTASRPKFMCLVCGKFFVSVESVTVHVKVHVEEKMFTCTPCNKIFLHRHIYDNHMKSEHKDHDTRCKYCFKTFSGLAALKTHLNGCTFKSAVESQTVGGLRTIKMNPSGQPNIALPITSNSNTMPVINEKKKANRPPPKLIMINNNNSQHTHSLVEPGSDHIIVQRTVQKVEVVRKPINIAPKPTESLLSDEAKKIFQNSTPPSARHHPGGLNNSNPRAHKIVETSAGREYIPDTNSNNIVNLDSIYPAPSSAEAKRGFMLRPCGEFIIYYNGSRNFDHVIADLRDHFWVNLFLCLM